MTAAALVKRDQAAAKLSASIRQLTSYINENPAPSERIILQKSEKVDVDREELIAKHHQYAEKSGTGLEEAEMKEFIEDKTDKAVDAVDTATAMIEKLEDAKKTAAEEVKKLTEEKKEKYEITCAKMKAESLEKLMLESLVEIDNLLITVNPTDVQAIQADMSIAELEEKKD